MDPYTVTALDGKAAREQTDGSEAVRPEPKYQGLAFLLTIAMGFVLVALGFVLQMIAWELNYRYGRQSISTISIPFYHWFGRFPDTHLVSVTMWFLWLYIAAWLHSLLYYADPKVFARVYAYRFVLCCVALAIYVSILILMGSLGRVVLVTSLPATPAFMNFVGWISWLWPVLLLLALIYWLRQTQSAFLDKDGIYRITFKVHKHKYMAEPGDEVQ